MPEQQTLNENDAPHQPDPLSLEKHQPDPMLDLSTGRMGSGSMSLLALAVVVILALVFYGLNGRSNERTASVPANPPIATDSGAPHG
jgi:hypothetical protein